MQVARELANRRARAPLKPAITEHWVWEAGGGANRLGQNGRLLPIVESLRIKLDPGGRGGFRNAIVRHFSLPFQCLADAGRPTSSPCQSTERVLHNTEVSMHSVFQRSYGQ